MSLDILKDLVKISYEIYELLLLDSRINGPISLLCSGKSAYFALSIIHLKCYDKERVSVEALPDDLSNLSLKLRPMVYVLDNVRTGEKIKQISSVLCKYNPRVCIRLASVNHPTFMPCIPIYMQFISPCAYSLDSLPDIDNPENIYCNPIITFSESYK